jgi:choline dehydrogenase
LGDSGGSALQRRERQGNGAVKAFDYVVVGAGSSGCILAARLSEDPANSVLLLEAGPAQENFAMRAPALFYVLQRSRYDWAYRTEPQGAVDARRMSLPAGRVLGGSSSINASLYVRGHKSDYDGWRDAGNPGWGWDDVLPYFRKSERQARGASEFHGTDGPIQVSDQDEISPSTAAFAKSVAALFGVQIVDDFNSGDSTGAGYFQVTCRNGRRCSAASFIRQVRTRPNLCVRTGAVATGIEFGSSRATGVRLRVKGGDEIVKARCEVILTAGAIGSPRLLMLSGIGPAPHLREVGVDTKLDLSGVGQNLRDHLGYPVSYEATSSSAPHYSLPASLRWIFNYMVSGGGGPLGRSYMEGCAFVRTNSGLERPDLQFHFAPWSSLEPNLDEKRDLKRGRGFTIFPTLLYPRSVGEIRLSSSDPMAPPLIDPRYLSCEEDLRALAEGARLARRVAETEPLSAFAVREVAPGPAVQGEDAIASDLRSRANSFFHPVGTCKMGVDAGAVVDPELRVRGIDGLRIADASIMPSIPGGNTNAPTMMVAEKAADLILGKT